MAATGSSTVLAEDVFVPAYRAQTMIGMMDGQYATDRHTAGDPYYNLPLAAVLAINAGGTPVGTARGAMDAFMERLPGRAITYTDYTDQSAAPVTHINVAEAALIIDSADAHMRLAARILDQPADGGVTLLRSREGPRPRHAISPGCHDRRSTSCSSPAAHRRSSTRCRSSASNATSRRSPTTPSCTPRPATRSTAECCAACNRTR